MQNKNKLRAQILLNPQLNDGQKLQLLQAVDDDALALENYVRQSKQGMTAGPSYPWEKPVDTAVNTIQKPTSTVRTYNNLQKPVDTAAMAVPQPTDMQRFVGKVASEADRAGLVRTNLDVAMEALSDVSDPTITPSGQPAQYQKGMEALDAALAADPNVSPAQVQRILHEAQRNERQRMQLAVQDTRTEIENLRATLPSVQDPMVRDEMHRRIKTLNAELMLAHGKALLSLGDPVGALQYLNEAEAVLQRPDVQQLRMTAEAHAEPIMPSYDEIEAMEPRVPEPVMPRPQGTVPMAPQRPQVPVQMPTAPPQPEPPVMRFDDVPQETGSYWGPDREDLRLALEQRNEERLAGPFQRKDDQLRVKPGKQKVKTDAVIVPGAKPLQHVIDDTVETGVEKKKGAEEDKEKMKKEVYKRVKPAPVQVFDNIPQDERIESIQRLRIASQGYSETDLPSTSTTPRYPSQPPLQGYTGPRPLQGFEGFVNDPSLKPYMEPAEADPVEFLREFTNLEAEMPVSLRSSRARINDKIVPLRRDEIDKEWFESEKWLAEGNEEFFYDGESIPTTGWLKPNRPMTGVGARVGLYEDLEKLEQGTLLGQLNKHKAAIAGKGAISAEDTAILNRLVNQDPRIATYVKGYVSKLNPKQKEMILRFDSNKLGSKQQAVQAALALEKAFANEPDRRLAGDFVDGAGAAKRRSVSAFGNEEAAEFGMLPIYGQVGSVPSSVLPDVDDVDRSKPPVREGSTGRMPDAPAQKGPTGVVAAAASAARRRAAESGYSGPSPEPQPSPQPQGSRVVETTQYSPELGGGSESVILRETPEARAQREGGYYDRLAVEEMEGSPGQLVHVQGQGFVPTTRTTSSVKYPPTYQIIDEDVSDVDFYRGTPVPQTTSKSREVGKYDPRVLDAPPTASFGQKNTGDFSQAQGTGVPTASFDQYDKLTEIQQATGIPQNELRYLLRKEGVKVGDLMYSSVKNPDGTFSIIETYQAPQTWYSTTDQNINYLANASGKTYAEAIKDLIGKGLLIEDETGSVNYYLKDGRLMARREEAVDPVVDYQRKVADYQKALTDERQAAAEIASETEAYNRAVDTDVLENTQKIRELQDKQRSSFTNDLMRRVAKLSTSRIEPSRWAAGARAGNGLGAIAYIMAMGQMGGAQGIAAATKDLDSIMERDINEQLLTREGQIKAIEEIRKTIPDIDVMWNSKADLAKVLGELRKAKFHTDVINFRDANWRKAHPDSKLSEAQALKLNQENANEALQAASLVVERLKTMAEDQTLTEQYDRDRTVVVGARKGISAGEALERRNLRAALAGLPIRDPETGQLRMQGNVDVTDPKYVPGMGMARSEALAKEALEKFQVVQEGRTITAELLHLIENNANKWSNKDRARAEQLVTELSLINKDKYKTGALDKGSQEVLADLGSNPIGWLWNSKGSEAKIRALHEGWNRSERAIGRNYIIGLEPASTMPGASGDTSRLQIRR